MGMEKDDDSAIIDQILKVVWIVSIICVLTGIGSIVCGCLTLAFADPVWDFPFSTGSGIWSGICVLLQGGFGIALAKKYDIRDRSASCRLLCLFHAFAQAAAITGGQHLGYSIAGVAICGTRSERDDGTEICHASEHDKLITVNSFGIVFAVLMLILGVGTIVYIVRGKRGATLTNNPNYGRCC